MSRSRFVVLAVATLAATTTACSALLDWSDFTGGALEGGTDGGTDGDATTTDSSTDGPAMGSDAADSEAPDVVVSCGDGGVCAPAAPSGWTGPVALYTGSSSVPACAGGSTSMFDGFGGTLTAPQATCSTCICGATGASCADPVVSVYDSSMCSGTPSTTVTPSSSCSAILSLALYVSVAPPVLTATCTPGTSTPTLTTASWSTVARACTVTGTSGCSAGSSCVSPQGTSTSVCVMKGDLETSCPPGYPGTPQVFYTGVNDMRGCSACSCGSVTDATCSIASPAVDTYSMPPCTSPDVTLSADGTCNAVGGDFFMELVATPTLNGTASCSVAGGGTATGTATGTGATSFCCLP